MNTTEIGAYIREPQQLNANHVGDLKKLCEDYPYSGLLHVLYLKALGNAKALDFEQYLKQHAIKIPNRELLYFLIHEDVQNFARTNDDEEVGLSTTLGNEDFVEVNDAEQVKIESHVEIETEQREFPVIEEINDAAGSVHDAGSGAVDVHNEEHEIPTNPQDGSVQESDTARYSLEDVSWLDNTITFDGFSTTMVLEEEEQQDDQEQRLAGEYEERENSDFSESIDFAEVQQEPISRVQPAEKESKQTFYDWLNAVPPINTTQQKETSSSTSDTVQIEQKMPATISVELKEEEKSKEDSPAATTSNIKEKTKALVDKFIETEPKISRPKAEFFSPVKSAKESVREDGIPVSETLAKIYELQGNFPKAIEVLEKLCNLLPNKVHELQNKIESIKLKMND